MQFSFLGFSVKKVMEFQLDVKDLAILRFFQDFMKSGKMNYEEVDGVKYYWISYKNISEEMPFLGLGKRTIMMRMLNLRDLGLLSHYTKKEGGTFSYYTLGDKFNDLLYISENRLLSNTENESKNSRREISGQAISNINLISGQASSRIDLNNKENSILNNSNNKESTISANQNNTKINKEKRLDYVQHSNEESEKSLQVNFEELIKSKEGNTDRDKSRITEGMDYGQVDLGVNNNSIDGQETLSEKNISTVGQSSLTEKNILKIGQVASDKNIKENQDLGQAEWDKSSEEKQTLAQDKLIEINKDSINHKEEDIIISEYPNQNNEDTLSKNMNRGCSSNDTTKTNLLNYLTTKNTNDLKSIKDKLEFILNYLNIKANVNYRITNRKTVALITARLREGFTPEDFKVVIDKKVSEWSGTTFEQYLNPFTLFGDKFELYLNQKVASKKNNGNGGVGNSQKEKFYKSDTRKLRFHNFTGREVDYDAIEKQLLGWE